jgi:hypothetical protein
MSPVTETPYTAEVFEYLGFQVDPADNRLTCRYRLDDWTGTEQVVLAAGGDWSAPAAHEAARLVFLLAGVSYYKAGAPPVIDLGDTAVTDTERDCLREFYIDGLGEFAYRSEPRLDLSGLEIRGPRLDRREPAGYSPRPGTPLIPFGGGVDSIVTVELLRPLAASPALFVVNRPGDRFEAIEKPAAVTGLPVVRAERLLDEQILRSAELGFRNGHVPVTGVISAIAVLAAAVGGHDAVAMSNEWSASVGTVQLGDRSINHQYSKSEAFEAGFRRVITEAIGPGDRPEQAALQYFSMLRPYSELWIAQRFAALGQYVDTFRSCNRAFHINLAQRLDHWCAHCDKCCFIDLILAPFLDASVLRSVFAAGGPEPLENPELTGQFETLLGLIPDAKPWECVGDIGECQVAAQLALARPDRAGSPELAALVARLGGVAGPADDTAQAAAEALLAPVGRHFIPEQYLPAESLR